MPKSKIGPSDRKRVSNAPPPINHLRPSGYSGLVEKAEAPLPINWQHWRIVQKPVDAWEAVFLSFGINPEIKVDWYKFDNAPNEFQKRIANRLREFEANINDKTFFSGQPVRVEQFRLHPVSLSEFSAWGLHVGYKDMPPELVAMASAVPKKSEQSPVTPGHITIENLASEIAQAKATAHPEKWGDKDGDPMRKTIVAAINKLGWSWDGIPGLLPQIIAMAEAKEISPKSTFNDWPPTSISLVKTNPANWYLSEADAEKVRTRFLIGCDQNSVNAASAEAKPQGDSTLNAQEGPAFLDGEPKLQRGPNKRAKVEVWVKWQAVKLKKDGDNGVDLADRIKSLADNSTRGYKSEQGELTIPSIVRMLPSGITGGRGKNRSKSKK